MEKVKTNNRTYAFIILALSLVIVGLGVALYFNSASMSSHAANLESVYQKSLYELIDNVNSMEVEVSKLLVTSDSKSTKQSISTIKQQSADAQNCLSFLPVSSSFVNSANKFVNQLNGYCTSFLNGDKVILSEQDDKTWGEIYDCIANLKYELNKLSLKVSQGYSIIDNLDNSKDVDGFSQNFSGISGDSLEYPSMIYDGPFSDSLLNQKINGLPEQKCTAEEAQSYVQEVFKEYNIDNIKYLGKTEGKFVTYNFSLAGEINYYVQVTEQGKFLLNISGNIEGGEIKINEEEAISKAEDFAKLVGIKDMKCVWKATSGNITYVNLAPVISGTILYPDLIKVKVDRTNGNIMGWEASNYAYNHTSRNITEFTKSQEEIISLVSKKISINSIKKCLIPLSYGGESFAYEVCGRYNTFTYYLYFDAQTGEQIKVLRVLQTSDGELLL